MFTSPLTKKPSPSRPLTPELTTQLTKTYRDEDFHVRRLTDPKNCISADDYIYVAHKNSQERVKLYHELFDNRVSEFEPTDKDKDIIKEDYLIIELSFPAKQTTLALRNIPTDFYKTLLPLFRS